MSQQNIYSIQLLNDLHNYFPDILYNPGRFNNVQDLLDYIRRVADVNPYTRGMNIYNSRQTLRQNNTAQSAFTPITLRQTSTSTEPIRPHPSVPTHILSRPTGSIMTPEEPIHPTRVSSNIRTRNITNPSDNLINMLFSGFLGGDIGNITTIYTDEIQTFLNENVPVYPTQEQITNASRLYHASTRQENICTICQDNIEPEQHIRQLNGCNHYFHKLCIDTWFRQNVHCPTCRQDIREVSTNNPPPVPTNYRRTNINTPDE